MSSNLKVNSLVPATGTEIGIGTTGGTIDFRCPATFGGNVTIGGTLTYDEVINIDSIGIVTARSGLKVTGGQLDVGSNIKLGNAGVVTATTFIGALTGNVTGNVTGNADTATSVNVTDESSDTLTFPLFVTASVSGGLVQTANLAPQAGSNFYFNSSTGALSATSINGNIVGGTVSGTTGTFTGDISIADKIIHTGDTDTFISFPAANTITAETGGGERLRIDSSGRVGLGITNPDAYFSSYNRVVMGRTNDTGGMTIVSASNSGGYIAFADGTSGNEAYRGRIIYSHGGSPGDYMSFHTDATEKLRITSGGNVGINTDVSGNGAGAKLVVGGRIQSNAGGYWIAGANGAEDGWHVQDSGGNLVVVESGVAERLRITSTGSLQTTASSGLTYFNGSSEYLFGNTVSYPVSGGAEADVQIHGFKTRAHFSINAYMNNAGGPLMQFVSSRSGTKALGTAAASTDWLGEIRFSGDDGSNDSVANGAVIYSLARAAATSGGVKADLIFSTSPASGTSPSEKLRITSGGDVHMGNSGDPSFASVSGNTAGGLEVHNIGNDTAACLKLTGNNNSGGSPGQETYTQLEHRGGNLTFNINHNGSERFKIEPTGNIRIFDHLAVDKSFESLTGNGVNAKLQVNTGSNDYDGIMLGGGYNRSTITTGGTYDLVLTSNAYPANATSKGIRFRCGTSGGGGPNERFRIHQDGMLETRQHGTAKTYWFSSGTTGGLSTCTIVIDAHAYHSYVIDVSHGGYAGVWGTARYMGYENGSMYYANEGTEHTDSNSRNITHDQNPGGGHKHRIRITGGMGTHPGVQLKITIMGPDAYIDTGDITYTWA